ncbi:MAG: hypothetical protein KAT33_01345, partial [Bacteroidales bacterium]|nr:hypothetical protein [Bacteroidales bacterium]
MTIFRISKLIFSLLFLLIFFSGIAQTTEESYKDAIESADKYFDSKDFIKAKTSYQYASRLKPDEQYPKDKINEVLELLRSQVSQNNLYAETIINADNLFEENKYNNSLTEYQNALKIFPDRQYPKDRISEINKILADEQANFDAYNQAILNGNNFFKDKDYENAKIEFQIALSLISGREYPKQKIDKINLLLAELEEKQEQYDEVIANAEKYLQRNNYKKAKIEYEKASIILPDKKFPKDKIAELNSIIEKQENYDKLIDEADNLYIVRDFNNSKEKYFEAAKIFPDDRYPKDMIEKINLALANKATTDKEDYNNAIANGDRYFGEGEYTNAKNEFEFASRLKPDEQYPKDKISEINIILEKLVAQKTINENYLSSIERADNYFDKKNYVEASKEYQNAIKINADEQYPKNRIEEINNILTAIVKQKAVEEKYEKAIADADNLFVLNKYEEAKIEYQNAISLKNDEQYPINKIKKIDIILAEIAEQKILQDRFNDAIAIADSLFFLKEYELAKTKYADAGKIKPGESFPNKKI